MKMMVDIMPGENAMKVPESSNECCIYTLNKNQQSTQSLSKQPNCQTKKPIRKDGAKSFGNRRSNILDPFSLDIWDPFEGFPLNTPVANVPSSARDTSPFANIRIDWKETPEVHGFKADLPGPQKKEVKVEVEEGRVLQISGERSKEQEEKNDKWRRVERSSGKFLRRFRLPENAKMDHIKASTENGVLPVTVAKEEEKKPEVKAADISG